MVEEPKELPWTSEAWRSMQIEKAKLLIDSMDDKPKLMIDRRKQAKQFLGLQPVYYDPNGLWWIWTEDKSKWIMGDEVDILNLVHSILKIDVVNSKVRLEIIQALMQVSRLQKPKDCPKHWIQFLDTLVNVKTGERMKATSEYFIRTPLPWKIGLVPDTPEMDKLFAEWVVGESQDISYVKTLYEIISYCACSEQFLQTIIALTGSGSNGKGSYLKLLTKFIGVENTCSTSLKQLSSGNFETSALFDKLMAQISEIDSGDLRNTGKMKQLSGEDLIRYEFKGKTPFSAYSPTTLIVATNSLPRTPDSSVGFYRRFLIVDFMHQFDKMCEVLNRVPDIEYENLACKIITLLKELYERGTFTNAGTFDERAKRYEERSNPLQIFIDKYCIEEVSQMIALRDFTEVFNNYLKKNHLRIMTPYKVGMLLRREGVNIGNRYLRDSSGEASVVAIMNFKFKNELNNFTQTPTSQS